MLVIVGACWITCWNEDNGEEYTRDSDLLVDKKCKGLVSTNGILKATLSVAIW